MSFDTSHQWYGGYDCQIPPQQAMFVLTTLSDVIPLTPDQFAPRRQATDALEDNIHAKFANKIIQNVGLCICLWDVLSASEGLIEGGDSSVYVKVTFRMVVFRPFRGEILQATVLSVNENGMRLSVDFFRDIWIPKENFFSPAEHIEATDENEKPAWVWKLGPEVEDFYCELDERVRFRVEGEIWHDPIPQKPILNDKGDLLVPDAGKDAVPYTIVGSMSSSYLGPIFWWEEQEVENEATGDEEEMITE